MPVLKHVAMSDIDVLLIQANRDAEIMTDWAKKVSLGYHDKLDDLAHKIVILNGVIEGAAVLQKAFALKIAAQEAAVAMKATLAKRKAAKP